MLLHLFPKSESQNSLAHLFKATPRVFVLCCLGL
jgi:hypothetical protein